MAAENREIRIHGSLLAAAEKRLLIWIARRLPRWINSDHLTVLGAVAMLGAGLSYVEPWRAYGIMSGRVTASTSITSSTRLASCS